MIELSRLHGQKIIVNAELIEFVEETPDTMIITTTGKKIMVKESIPEIVEKVITYKKKCFIDSPIQFKIEEKSDDIPPTVE